MTTIDRLGLLGIRSYGTDDETFIKFYKPLTIILGRNGSGKSTIIEAVKMATTGDLPPMVDNGAAFIHDPRVHNETETKAKIRLLFTNVRGDQYVVSRHFQLSLKKGPRSIGYKTEFKTIDQTVKRMDGGAASSFRCADLNALLPEIMRVTKPVLNNVIFVHQEDSLWPLGKSQELKLKFDQIFAATRYTKALDTIRKLRREQAADLKTVKVELLHYEDKVKALEKVRGEVDETRVKHDELQRGVDTLDNTIAGLATDKQAAELTAQEYNECRSKLTELNVERELVERYKSENLSKMSMHVPDMSDEALNSEIDDLKRLLTGVEGERTERWNRIQKLRSHLEMKREEVKSRQSRKGTLEQVAKEQSNRVSRLESMKEELDSADYFRMTKVSHKEPLSLPPRTARLQEWTDAISNLHKEAEEQFRLTSEDCNMKLDAATNNLNNAKWRVREGQSTYERKTEEVRVKKARLFDVRLILRELSDSNTSLKEAEGRLGAAKNALNEKKRNAAIPRIAAEIHFKKKEVVTCTEELDGLREARQRLQDYQNEHAKYDIFRDLEKRKKTRMEGVVEDFTDLIASAVTELCLDKEETSLLLNGMLPSSTNITLAHADRLRNSILEATDDMLSRKDASIRQAERYLSIANANLKSASLRKAEATDQFEGISQRVKDMSSKLSEASASIGALPKAVISVEPVLKVLRESLTLSGSAPYALRKEHLSVVQQAVDAAELAVVKANQKTSQLESGALLAEDELETFEQDPKHRCPACGLGSSKKVDDMRRNLKSRIQYLKDPESSKAAARELIELDHLSRTLKSTQTTGLTAVANLLTYDAAEAKLLESNNALKECEKKAREAEAALGDLQARFGVGSAMDQICSKRLELKQVCVDWKRAANDVVTLKAELSATSSDARSLSKIDEDIKGGEDRMKNLLDDIDKNSRALERERDNLHRIENRFHACEKQCLNLHIAAEDHMRLKKEKEELSKFIRETELETETLQESLNSLQLALGHAEEEQVTTRVENDLTLKEANAVLSKRNVALQRWNDCVTRVEAFNRSRNADDLKNIVASLQSLEHEIECLENDLQGHENEQDTASTSKEDIESKIRNLRDNQSFRIDERKVQVINRSAKHIQDDISSLERASGGNPNDKVKELTARINSRNETRANIIGQRQAILNQYKVKKKEMTHAEEQGSRGKFDEARIRKQTMELASSDLNKYHRALDQALMAFHTLKMNSINRTIKELWQQTYRGNDIEEIEIVSDHGAPRSNTTGAPTRTFNYRVQMRQGQATLDMRGRCSAGQKVLACLVIRLALAESFCTDCGILALDEPTTNLDRENIESLAKALRAIIESRRKQRSFQLVLITHDEEFIDLIGARNFCNEFFMIYKDKQGISQARVQDLREM
ncbi:unnamed protein product [Chondrus crispus]|uniref:DNA repair protein RAD50 n=1 Tax=Chondrus crispus TaxID=2769 RepID=R7QJW4_CHOCR|nr:unnamed protein product [Chondrus crispus]CDF38379.1 unnamed protein product [Chondrus crispus]|eukprot:XP_005718264.1 unnamed protein product [Chondrus crispus]